MSWELEPNALACAIIFDQHVKGLASRIP